MNRVTDNLSQSWNERFSHDHHHHHDLSQQLYLLHFIMMNTGWLSVIISFILYPALMIFSKLLAFPVWLDMIWKSKNFYILRTNYTYPEDNFVAKEIYTSMKAHGTRGPNGFVCYADKEGGTWYESFWGIIHSLNMDVKDEVWYLYPSFVTIVPGKWMPSSMINVMK